MLFLSRLVYRRLVRSSFLPSILCLTLIGNRAGCVSSSLLLLYRLSKSVFAAVVSVKDALRKRCIRDFDIAERMRVVPACDGKRHRVMSCRGRVRYTYPFVVSFVPKVKRSAPDLQPFIKSSRKLFN